MAGRFFGAAARLPATKHALLMREVFPALKLTRRGREFIWVGPLQPTTLSATYTVKVTYADGKIPKVYVLSPLLKPRPDSAQIPHTYDQGTRLCLYDPLGNEWRSTSPLSRTIVPWTCLWLLYYEIWHATGTWLGGGQTPGNDNAVPVTGPKS